MAVDDARNDLRFIVLTLQDSWTDYQSVLQLFEPDILDEDFASALYFDADFSGCLADSLIVIDGLRDQMPIQYMCQHISFGDDLLRVPIVLLEPRIHGCLVTEGGE